MSETNTNEDKYAKCHNLIRKSDLSSEERKARASKGGKASVKARRRKKELKQLLELALSQPQTENPSEDNYFGITVALINRALQGDVKAFGMIRDTIGQKPEEKVEVKNLDIQIDVEE